MAILLKTTLVRVSSIQIMQIRVQNKGKRVWKSRYDGDVSAGRWVWALGRGKPLAGDAGHDVGDAHGAVVPLVGDIETYSLPFAS